MALPSSPRRVFSLEQAVDAAAPLAALQERLRASQWCLEQIQPLMPAPLRTQVTAGPLDGNEWCLLVRSAAASAKLRQLLPTFVQALAQRGAQVSAIRLKVQTPTHGR